MLGMLGVKDDHFGFISNLIVRKYCYTEDEIRRQAIQAIVNRSSKVKSKKAVKTVNELVALLQKEPFFKSISTHFKVMTEISQNALYEQHWQGGTIFSIGDEGRHFYLVLAGKVHLTIPDEIEGLEKQPRRTKKDSFPGMKRKIRTEPATPKKGEEQEKIVKVVQVGESFGELVPGAFRLMNATAMEDCQLLCFDHSTYETLLQAQLKSEHHQRSLFLQDLPTFSFIPPFALSRISALMMEEHLNYGQTLFNISDPLEKIFVVTRGSFKLSRQISRHSFVEVRKQEHKTLLEDNKNAEYLVVEKGEVLGDSEALNMLTSYQQSCVCESQGGTVLSISKKHFFRIALEGESDLERAKLAIGNKNQWKSEVVNSFIDRRSRNSFMNTYLHDPKRAASSVAKKKKDSMNELKAEVDDDSFFYNEMNKTIIKSSNKQRFSMSRAKCKTETSCNKNLFAIKTKNKQTVPHGVQDIVELVKLKSSFQRRFRKDKKIKCLFKFDEKDAPLYIKSRFNRIN